MKNFEEVTQGREAFDLTAMEYNSLTLEVQKELDKNYWRFPNFKGGYSFKEMYPEEKEHFKNEEMVIYHSIFEHA